MSHGKEEPPITNKDGIALKGVLNSFVFWNWVWEKLYYKGGHYNWLKVCNQLLNLYTKHPHTSAKIANLTTLSPLLSCWVRQCRIWREALPHCSTAALRATLPHLSNRWEAGGYLYFFLSSIMSLSPSSTVQTDENQQVLISSLSSIGALQALKLFLWLPHQSLKEKGAKNV